MNIIDKIAYRIEVKFKKRTPTFRKELVDNNVELSVRHLKQFFKFGHGRSAFKTKAVHDVSFDIMKGECFGLVGESGCGKTTTGRTLIRLYNATSGSVYFEGARVSAGSRWNEKEIKWTKIRGRKKIKELKKIEEDEVLKLQDSTGLVTKIENINVEVSKIERELMDLKTEYKDRLKQYDDVDNEDVKAAKIEEINREYSTEVDTRKVKLEALNEELKSLRKEVNESRRQTLDSDAQKNNEANSVANNESEASNKEEAPQHKTYFYLFKEDADGGCVVEETAPFEGYKDESLVKEEDRKALQDYIAYNSSKKSAASTYARIAQVRAKYAAERQAIKDHIDQVEREQLEAIAQIKYDNRHVNKKLMSKMQMIFQDPVDSLDPRMTVEDIIQEGLHIQGQYNKYKNSQKVKEVLVKVGLLPEYASRYPHEFSGGQRQRIGIARALVMNPQFLICDEPISALDVSIRAQIINLLNDLKEEMGLTILFIAHDLSVVKYFCDRIAVMYYGEIVELASSDELFAHPLHPYTHALLSAIPKPDPLSEKTRVRYHYIPANEHDYSKEAPKLVEIVPGHWVLANSEELEKYKLKLK